MPNLSATRLVIQINAIASSLTAAAIVPKAALKATGTTYQDAEIIALSVALLMPDEPRDGQLLILGREDDRRWKKVCCCLTGWTSSGPWATMMLSEGWKQRLEDSRNLDGERGMGDKYGAA